MMVLIYLLATITSPADTKPEVITNYFRFSENNLDTQNFRVILIGDFNTPRFDWKRGLSQPKCHYSKLKGETSKCLLDLRQPIDAVGSSSLLDIAFTNCSELNINLINLTELFLSCVEW
jgi:hypothetical protein